MAELDDKKRDNLSDRDFALPDQHKLPINDKEHVRNAAARFNQVQGVSTDEKKKAAGRIERAAKREGVHLDKPLD